MSESPVRKRLKLDPSASPSPPPERGDSQNLPKEGEIAHKDVAAVSPEEVEDDEDHCVICLQHIRDRTVLPCAHDRMCFECILVWTAQSRKCPLCNAPIGPFLIHNMRSKYDYQKRFLPPLRSSSPPILSPMRGSNSARNRGRSAAARWGTRRRSASRERQEMEDQLELAVERRKWVYRHGLYAKHIASNPYTRYRPAPTPAQIAASPDLISRATIFVRRELRVWVNLDVEFLTTFILSLMKTLDLRSESSVKLLAEFLDMDTPYHIGDTSESTGRFTNAEQFAHELYSYLRSPFRDLPAYDSAVQYDTPEHVPPAPAQPRKELRRWDTRAPARADTSTRGRRRSSPSPLSRSPRDAYSASPLPARSHSREEHERYEPSLSPRDREAASRDRKGKRKEIAPVSQERGDGQSRRRSRSLGRNSVQPGRHRAGSSRERRIPRSTPDEPYSLQRDTKDTHSNGERPAKSSSQLFTRITSPSVDVQRNTARLDANPRRDGKPVLDNAPAPAPAKSEATWGISIKGQAKLLNKTRDSNGEHQNPRPSQDSHPDVPQDTISKSIVLGSDAMPTCLGQDFIQDGLPSNAPTTGSDGGGIKHGSQKGESRGGDLISRHSADLPSRSLPVTQRSAPEIMARTRAKLAKLRGQPSVAGVTAASDTGEDSRGSTPANLDHRTRLLERLEEEKRQAFSQPTNDHDPEPGCRSKSEDSKRTGPTATEVETVESPNKEDSGAGVSSDSRQAEVKLRAQAMLRVRLAAEKRRFEEEQTTSREDALRSKLLSRRA